MEKEINGNVEEKRTKDKNEEEIEGKGERKGKSQKKSSTINDFLYGEPGENIILPTEKMIENEERQNLVKVFKDVKKVLNEGEKGNKSINEVYERYLENKFITKSHVKKEIGQCLLKFMFFFVGPLFGTIFLIGVFQVISILNALSDLLKDSFITYYDCKIDSNCNITTIENETSVYHFYEYYYDYTMNKSFDFNLMLITGFISSLMLDWAGYRLSTAILGILNLSGIIWLLNFNFKFRTPDVFDYDIFKLLNLGFIYILLLIAIGGSALLSHKVLIESHLKYKDYLIKKMEVELKPKNNEKEKNEKEKKEFELIEINEDNNNNLLPRVTEFIKAKNDNLLNKEESKLEHSKTEKIYLHRNNIEKQKQKILQEKITKKANNKFDYFIMICLTTIIGYFGKYLINILLNIFLTRVYKDNYDKRIFLYYIMGLYASSIIFSIIFYQIFKVTIFEYDEKGEEKKKDISICQVCGYIIYREKSKPNKPPKRNCFTLCCESIQNCCNTTFCHLFSVCDICKCEPHCSCRCCEYDFEDYNKNKEEFLYCYKTQRKSFWCNKFFSNRIQKKLFPYMIEYFILQLTKIGFEKQYDKHKKSNTDIKIWTTIFIFSFILFIYFTLSFSKMVICNNKLDDDDEDEKYNENGNKRLSKLEIITKLSNDILNGTHGILLFNGVFSLIFSIFYLSNISEEIKTYFFKYNIILIPILMNKFYFFTLHYYCIYTSEKYQKFEIISNSSLISIYISIWNIILALIKTSIPENINSNQFNCDKILYIIQIIFSSIPALGVAVFIVVGLFNSSGLYSCLMTCNCIECVKTFSLHKFLFCLVSFILCCGGCWNRLINFQEYDYNCCGFDDCCDIAGNCCDVYCLDNYIYCVCCYCDEKSLCFWDCCYENCYSCKICGCCTKNNDLNIKEI